MIRIHKPAQPPAVLQDKGSAERQAQERLYDASAADYDSGKEGFKFDRGIYGHPSVKATLIQAQHGKCCFCESKITHVQSGDVEHFRPKSGYRQNPDDTLGKPGYYWLAYDWDNLLVCCELCNRRYKANLFPLANPAQRALSHHDPVACEEPLFIHPAQEDPAGFIFFSAEVPKALSDNARGEMTIAALGLGRKDLEDRRRNLLLLLGRLYRAAKAIAAQPNSSPEDQLVACEAERALARAQDDSAEYAGMVRAAVAAKFEAVPEEDGLEARAARENEEERQDVPRDRLRH